MTSIPRSSRSSCRHAPRYRGRFDGSARLACLLLCACNQILGNDPLEPGREGALRPAADAAVRDASVEAGNGGAGETGGVLDAGCEGDRCAPAPDAGRCEGREPSPECGCAAGFEPQGDRCRDIDECASGGVSCGEHARCVNLSGSYRCECEAGHAPADGGGCRATCDANPCVRGTCRDTARGYSCSCPEGYGGPRCEIDIDDCALAPCVHGTCSDGIASFTCTCEPGWAGSRCDVGSCENRACPASAPCQVPPGNAGLCYPRACGIAPGLCLAYNADGSGTASTELLTETNPDFNFGTNNDWNDKSRYFAYLRPIADHAYVCVFPQKNLQGTPIVIPLGQSRSRSEGFGQSNAYPDAPACAQHGPATQRAGRGSSLIGSPVALGACAGASDRRGGR